jgi:hypothetical protein
MLIYTIAIQKQFCHQCLSLSDVKIFSSLWLTYVPDDIDIVAIIIVLTVSKNNASKFTFKRFFFVAFPPAKPASTD